MLLRMAGGPRQILRPCAIHPPLRPTQLRTEEVKNAPFLEQVRRNFSPLERAQQSSLMIITVHSVEVHLRNRRCCGICPSRLHGHIPFYPQAGGGRGVSFLLRASDSINVDDLLSYSSSHSPPYKGFFEVESTLKMGSMAA